jgi:hypothetical protein
MTRSDATRRQTALVVGAGAILVLIGTLVAWTTDHAVVAQTAQSPTIVTRTPNLWSDAARLAALIIISTAVTVATFRVAHVHRLRARGALVAAILTLALAAYGVSRAPGRPITRLVGQSAGGYAVTANRYSRGAGRYLTLGGSVLLSLGVAISAFAAPEPRRRRPDRASRA